MLVALALETQMRLQLVYVGSYMGNHLGNYIYNVIYIYIYMQMFGAYNRILQICQAPGSYNMY